MKNLLKNKNLIYAVVLIIVVGGAMYYFLGRSQSSDAVVTASSGSTVDDQLLASLRQLRSIKLDDSIFTNPVWLSLVDESKPLVPRTPGRVNPFAPIGQSGQSTTTAQ